MRFTPGRVYVRVEMSEDEVREYQSIFELVRAQSAHETRGHDGQRGNIWSFDILWPDYMPDSLQLLEQLGEVSPVLFEVIRKINTGESFQLDRQQANEILDCLYQWLLGQDGARGLRRGLRCVYISYGSSSRRLLFACEPDPALSGKFVSQMKEQLSAVLHCNVQVVGCA